MAVTMQRQAWKLLHDACLSGSFQPEMRAGKAGRKAI